MLTLLISTRNIYGDFILQMLLSIINYENINDIKLNSKIKEEYSIVSEIISNSSMMLGILIALLAFLLIIISTLYIPLPNHICDRQKIQLIEFLLRLSNEYFGDLVEIVFGTKARTYLSRFLVGLPYILQKKPPKWVTVKNKEIGGVKCRVYTPDSSMKKTNGLIVFIHGGGWCLMQPKYYDGPIYMLMMRLGCTVVSIDYKLAPEITFPSPVLECEKVVKEIYENEYINMNIDRSKIAIMGDSAGGNLSAVVCQRLHRENKSHYIKSQVLIYPVINITDFQSPSYQYYDKTYNGTGLLNRKIFGRMVLGYLGIEPNQKNVQLLNQNKHLTKSIRESKEYISLTDHNLLPENFRSKEFYTLPKITESNPELSKAFLPYIFNPDINPLYGKNLYGLSEAMIITTGIDILRDEGILYAKRLESFNVPVKWYHYDRAFHGIINMPKSKQRRRIIEDIVNHLQNKI